MCAGRPSAGQVTAAVLAQSPTGAADAARTIALSSVLPNVDYHNQAIYTQPQRPYDTVNTQTGNGGPVPIFVANNSVREYVSQGVVTETIGLGKVEDVRRSYAEAAAAKARLEIARRGLVAAVVGAYYGVLANEERARIAAGALDEADRFLKLTQQLESGGEVAHADVLKADLQQTQRQRELEDSQLAAEKARLDLGVLLFRDPTTAYTLAKDLQQAPPALPTRGEIEANAKSGNPDVRAAMASLRAAELGVSSSTAAYLPEL